MPKPNFNGVPFDPEALGMKKMPPAAVEAYHRANALREANMLPGGARVIKQTSNGFLAVRTANSPRAAMTVTAHHTPKGKPEMPAVATSKNLETKPAALKRKIVPEPN